MTVLVEGISVIIKLEAIERVIPDGWEGFRQYIPNFAWCKDDNLVRLAFLSPEEATKFAEKLESLKLEHWGKEGAQDLSWSIKCVAFLPGVTGLNSGTWI